MPFLLFLALVCVYVVSVAGIVVVGSMVGSARVDDDVDLEERLALIRAAGPQEHMIIGRRASRAANTAMWLHRVLESIARAFTPVGARRTRNDVAASGSLRSARFH